MKKIFFVGISAAMLLALSACDNPAPTQSNNEYKI